MSLKSTRTVCLLSVFVSAGCSGSVGVVDAGDDAAIDASVDANTFPDAGDASLDAATCQPNCDGRECGSDGCGGACLPNQCADGTSCVAGRCQSSSATILWRDSLQDSNATAPWGFGGLGTAHPIETIVPPGSDSNGANLSRVSDPAGGPGYALRHMIRFDPSGRAQAGIYGSNTAALQEAADSGERFYVAMEMYFPSAMATENGANGWISIWDWHTHQSQAARWHTAPGLFLSNDGSMRVSMDWGGTGGEINGWDGPESATGLPVGEWFDLEMAFQWTEGTTTLSVWLNGEPFLEQSGVQTKGPGHDSLEFYSKWYGYGPWSPQTGIRYTRNVRIARERITASR